MANPSLPPMTPPPIPTSQAQQTPSGGSNLLFLMVTMFLVYIILQSFMKPKTDPPLANLEQEKTVQKDIAYPKNEEAVKKLDAKLVAEAKKSIVPQFITLGSMDASSENRMLVTLTNQGAAVARIELNESAYNDTHDKTGYLGQIVVDETLIQKELDEKYPGVSVQVVGTGTPAAKAGLVVGDRIVGIAISEGENIPIDSFLTLREELLKTRPKQEIKLQVLRQAKINELKEKTPEALAKVTPETVSVTLQSAPVSIVRPEGIVRSYRDYENMRGLLGISHSQGKTESKMNSESDSDEAYDLLSDLKDPSRKGNSDPLSFLMTLSGYGDEKLDWFPGVATKEAKSGNALRPNAVNRELPEVELRTGNWEYLASESNAEKAVFRKILLGRQLEVRKIYTLTKGSMPDAKGRKNVGAREYDLALTVELINLDEKAAHKVSYILDGPTGLPIEGAWYSSGRKTGPGWGLYGLRDLVINLDSKGAQVVKCQDIATDSVSPSDRVKLDFLGVDTQYFQCTMIPEGDMTETWHESYIPLRVGSRDRANPTMTNVSFRMKSQETELAPKGQNGSKISHQYRIFAGPKKPAILACYGLQDTLVYGWFWFVAIPLLWILHFFNNYVVFNYGLAIVLLTILVRLILFPLSMKQVVSSLKMQQIQPQLTALKEKYKDNAQEMMKAQQALFRENGVNPLGGCLPLFIQLPIFIGLYKALSLDVNLYGAPLFTESFRWCSNLSAPDMLVDWSQFWESIGCYGFNMGHGMLYLGPFFNLLPMLTIVLFLIQQKFLMPPVVGTDEAAQQQRLMRRMMNFMMIFMGFMFFKVPSGLCLYFIVSSLWGILERQFHPKTQPVADGVKSAVAKVALQGYDRGTKAEYNTEKPKKGTRNRRHRGEMTQTEQTPAKGKLRAWWDNVLARAKEQQKIAKAEQERRRSKKYK